MFRFLVICVFFISLQLSNSAQLTSYSAAELAQVNINLPSITLPFGSGEYIRLFNGVMVDHNGPFVNATLYKRIVNADFNNDSHVDAAIIVDVYYNTTVGYNGNLVTHIFVVLQDYVNGPQVSYGYPITKYANASIDIFSSNVDNTKIVL
jgi:hypothetical protein